MEIEKVIQGFVHLRTRSYTLHYKSSQRKFTKKKQKSKTGKLTLRRPIPKKHVNRVNSK